MVIFQFANCGMARGMLKKKLNHCQTATCFPRLSRLLIVLLPSPRKPRKKHITNKWTGQFHNYNYLKTQNPDFLGDIYGQKTLSTGVHIHSCDMCWYGNQDSPLILLIPLKDINTHTLNQNPCRMYWIYSWGFPQYQHRGFMHQLNPKIPPLTPIVLG